MSKIWKYIKEKRFSFLDLILISVLTWIFDEYIF